jgi:hypothetical protein
MAALLVFVIFGSVVFSRAEAPNNSEIRGRKPYSTGVFIPFAHSVFWLAEETSIVSKAKKNSSSVLWNGALRALMPADVQSAANGLIIISAYITSHIYFSNINEAIPLKLRI